MLKQLRPAIASVLGFTIFTGFVFPFVIFGLGQLLFPTQANGSLLNKDGKLIGSTLIGQNFTKAEYFHSRPSAAGSGYDAGASGGTNLGPTSNKLINGIPDNPKTKDTDESYSGIKQLAQAYRKENDLAADATLPADAVTRSASGLDPDISPANAALQAPRVAKARKLPVEKVQQLIVENTQGPQLGIFGDSRVNIVRINLALDSAK